MLPSISVTIMVVWLSIPPYITYYGFIVM